MKNPYTEPGPNDTPIGIIISRGSRKEPTPRVAAYIWGTAPAAEATTHATTKAA